MFIAVFMPEILASFSWGVISMTHDAEQCSQEKQPIDPGNFMLSKQMQQAKALIDTAERIVVLTGAGISTDSGIPDFRGPHGVWTKNPGAEKAANLEYYMNSKEVRIQAWKNRLKMTGNQRKPNPGHLALRRLEDQGKLHTLITQNIDGLHHKAGSDASLIIEVHGNIREVVCMECGDRAPMERALMRVRNGDEDPACRRCGGILKSATISFGQTLVAADLQRADEAARQCDLMLAIGSTLSVYPIAGVVPLARQSGARVIILNGEPTGMDDLADVVLHGSISNILPDILT